MNLTRPLLLLVLGLTLLAGCESRREEPAPPPQTAAAPEAPAPSAKTIAAPEESDATPPAPPITENFDGEPQLSLFPRAGAFRPEDDDSEGLSYWKTFLDHLLKTSGIAGGAGRDGGRAWSLRSIKGLDSVGFFSPLAVEPETTYRLTFAIKGELPEGGEAGVGVLEFDRFLWIGDQFTETMVREHQTGSHEGVRLRGKREEWQEESFTFTTSAATGMVHLILFREGEAGRPPVFFDDIRIAKLEQP